MTVEADPRARTRTFVVVGVVVVLLAVAAAVGVLIVHRHDRPSTPADAARQWAQAVVDRRGDAARALECRRGLEQNVETLLLTVTGVSGVSARTVSHHGGDAQVEVRLLPSSTATLTVTVIRRDGRYLVCD